ncbi:MAG: hypothetical protein DME05_18510 [Candidatus Rokuibacteriota bacterium]|nr:MAG: hypothetical protein DME05_18510 [Candidatus Rokubacteria bacterium]
MTSEISESLSAFESARVDAVWHAPKARHHGTKLGAKVGQPLHRQATKANGRRKVKRPQTLMYSSSAWPKRFIAVLRSAWNNAAARDRTIHMGGL